MVTEAKPEGNHEQIISYCGDCTRFITECRHSAVEKNDPVGDCHQFELARKGYERIKKERGKKSKAQVKPIKINISDLFSDSVGKYVEIDCQVVGRLDQKALPRIIMASCPYCGLSKKIDILKDKGEIKDLIFEQRKVVEIAGAHLAEAVCTRGGKKSTHYAQSEVISQMDFAILHVRDNLQNIDKFDDSIYKNRRIYLINQRIPKDRLVKIKGHVVIEPNSRDITIIADTIESLEGEFSNFSISEEDKVIFPKYFNDLEVVAEQISPDTVGEKRKTPKKSITLQLHSPHTIPDINGNPVRGGLRVIFIGDTKCNKSGMSGDISGKDPNSYKFAEYFSGETGGRTGLTYTIDSENKILIWGSIPLNDKGMVVIDGMGSISSAEIKQTREVLQTQKITVRHSQHGEAWARTRLLGCMNPGKKQVKPMNEYLYPCMAILDSYIFRDTPEISRWDMFIPFAYEDVSGSEIAKRKPTERPIPDKVYDRHIQWVWSREPEQIIYEAEAKQKIIELSIDIGRDYSLSSLPIVHNGFRETLSALSVAYAATEHSTDETHEKIIVKPSHVINACDFYKNEILESLGLRDYKLHIEGELSITDNDIIQIHQELKDIEYAILDAIKIAPMSSNDLANKFDISVPTIKRHYVPLKEHGLIKTISGKGAELTSKGTKFLRLYLKGGHEKHRIIVSKSDTKSIEDNEFVSEYDTSPDATVDSRGEEFVSKSDTKCKSYNKNPEIVSQNDTMIRMKDIPPVEKHTKRNTMSQKEQIDYTLGLIKIHDSEGGISKESVIDIAEDRISSVENIIEHLLKEGRIYESLGKLRCNN